ncbi:OLC1v1005552C7 [Oldenlandia corymbosa var. corymbosa]|nr:OLC1v1005552C7 [Oldenlandia corymbosa var. corymbosa]
MNVVVHKARHPQLRDYIQSSVNGLLPFIKKNEPMERFVFKVNLNLSYGSKVEEANLEFALRSFLIKLPVSESLTKTLPKGCRWEITSYFRALPETGKSKDAEMWIPTETKQWQQPPLITPIKSMNSEPLGVQLYLEHPSLSKPEDGILRGDG